MESYGDVLAGAGMVAYIVIGLAVLFFGWWGYRLLKGSKKQKDNADLPSDESYESISASVKNAVPPGGVVLGKGGAKCLCFRQIEGLLIADFTTISKPVGEMYQFDPSCPINGNGYIVKQLENGEVVDYDPREVRVEIDTLPETAWHAINWRDDVVNFWTVATQWWKNLANWYAAAVLGLVFMGILVVMG